MITLYRDRIYLPKESEVCGVEIFDLGPLRAEWRGLRFPVWLALFFVWCRL